MKIMLVLPFLLMSACSMETTQQKNERFYNICESYGFERNTPYHANCVMTSINNEETSDQARGRFLMAYGAYMMNGQQQ